MTSLPCVLDITTVQRQYTEKPTDFSSIITPLCTITEESNIPYLLSHFPLFITLQLPTDINIFKHPIKPLWEDEQNIKGGKYIIKVKKHVGQRLFEKMFVNFSLNKSTIMDNVNGLVASIRAKQVMISLWIKTVPKDHIETINEIRRILGVDYELIVEFKDNDESLKDKSSYRNTAMYGKKDSKQEIKE
ncbi:Eukaryotic translation initiation factor 4E type 2 [Binucleata daphniae]